MSQEENSSAKGSLKSKQPLSQKSSTASKQPAGVMMTEPIQPNFKKKPSLPPRKLEPQGEQVIVMNSKLPGVKLT